MMKLKNNFGITLLLLLLLGYAFFSKGFAYISINIGFPIYIGEIILFVLVIYFNKYIYHYFQLNNFLSYLILFLLFGVIRTIPFLTTFGIDALRDSAIWYYSIYTIIAIIVFDKENQKLIFNSYSQFITLFLLWVPIVYALYSFYPELLQFTEGIPFFYFKAGDIGVHLGAIIVFLLLAKNNNIFNVKKINFLLILAFCDILIVAAVSRGGLLSFIIGLLILSHLINYKYLLKFAIIISFLLAILWLSDFNIIGRYREISFQQITSNFISVFGQDAETRTGDLQGTVSWRLLFWSDILKDIFSGDQILVGRGFGVNIAYVYGYVNSITNPLRSPHNFFVTIIARMGVIGIILISLFILSTQLKLRRIINKTKEITLNRYIAIYLYIYIFMAITNSMFDVYLEGPQGAIWFWVIMGFSVRLIKDTQTNRTILE